MDNEQDFIFNVLSELNRDPQGASRQRLVVLPNWAAVYDRIDTFASSLNGTGCTINILPGQPHLQEVLACVAECSRTAVLKMLSNNPVPVTLLSVIQS